MSSPSLGDLFLSALPHEARAPLSKLPADVLASALAECVARAQAAHPGFAPVPDRFVPYLAARISDHTDVIAGLRALHVEDLALSCAALDGAKAAVKLLEQQYLPALDALLKRRGIRADQLEELRQVLLSKLLVAPPGGSPPKIALYAGKGTLQGWLFVVATRELQAAAQKGSREEVADVEVLGRTAQAEGDHEMAYLKARYGRELKEAFEVAMKTLSARDRNVLRYSIIDGLGIDRIAELQNVHRATAARWLEAARAHILKETRKEMAARLNVSRDELESLVRLVQSDLNLSLSRLLR